MAAGCDAHLAKPLKKAVLLAALVERTAPETRRAVPAT
jgi:CheY-like chemotaxis protein